MHRSLLAAGLAAALALAPLASAGAAEPGKRVLGAARSLFLVREAVTPDAAPRDVDYGAVLAVQAVDSPPGARLIDAYKAPLGNSLAPAGALLTAVRHSDGSALWCHASKGNWVLVAGTKMCFRDADKDGRLDETFFLTSEPGFSRIAYAGTLTPTRIKPLAFETITEPGAPREVLVLRYLGPTEGLVQDGQVYRGVVEFEVAMGPDAAHASRVGPVRVRLDAAGRGRTRVRLGYEIVVEKVTSDGRARVQLLAGPPVGETEL